MKKSDLKIGSIVYGVHTKFTLLIENGEELAFVKNYWGIYFFPLTKKRIKDAIVYIDKDTVSFLKLKKLLKKELKKYEN